MTHDEYNLLAAATIVQSSFFFFFKHMPKTFTPFTFDAL